MPTSRPMKGLDRTLTTPDAPVSGGPRTASPVRNGRPPRAPRGKRAGMGEAQPMSAASAPPDWLKPHERPSRPRRSPKLIAIGVLCACLGGLGAAFAWTSMTTAQSVIVVQRAVAQGDVIAPGDFGITDVSVPIGVATVPGDQLSGLIGKQALVDLTVGSLIGPKSVGSVSVPAGEAVVGIDLGPGHAPVNTLPYGAQVILLQVPRTSDTEVPDPWTMQATVVTTSVTNPDGSVLVDVSLSQENALLAAAFAAQGELAVVRMGG